MLRKDGNLQIYPKKKKGASQRGSGNRVPSHLNESPFANSITNFDEKVKENFEERFALPEEGGVSYDELMSLENVTAFDPAAVLAKGAPREVRQRRCRSVG